jgi:hypothetical protein
VTDLQRLVLAELTVFHRMEHGVLLVSLHLSDVHIAEAVTYKGLKLFRCFHQPLKHGVRAYLKHSGSGTHASPLVSARQDAYDQSRWHTPAVEDGPVRCPHIASTGGAVVLTPGGPMRMTVRVQVATAAPASIRTAAMGTAGHRGVDLLWTSVGQWLDRLGWPLLCCGASAGPGKVPHANQPQESQDHHLIAKMCGIIAKPPLTGV